MNVWILAAGEATRWPLPIPKQMMPIGDELLIERTMRQVDERGGTPVVLYAEPTMMIGRRHPHNSVFMDESMPHRWTVETALQAVTMTPYQAGVVLLGDVIFTNEAMDAIFHTYQQENCRVFMRTYFEHRLVGFYREIFGFRYGASDYDRVVTSLQAAIREAAKGEHDNFGKLREFFTHYCGVEWAPNSEYEAVDEVSWPINCLTDDIDLLEDYERYVAHVILGGKIDARH